MTERLRLVAARLRPHRVFVALFAVGVVLRALLAVAAWPGFFMWGDSYGYLQAAAALRPGTWRPIGYGAFLRVVTLGLHATWLVVVLQHLLGLVAAVLLYRLALRLTGRPWAAAVAAAPVLLDVLELTVEHAVMADTLFLVLLAGALALLIRRPPPSYRALSAAGAMLAGAALTRTVGLPLLVLVLLYGLVRRWGARRTGAFAAAALLPVLGYAAAYDAVNGRFAIQGEGGIDLYGRVQATVPCGDVPLPATERPLCRRPHLAPGTPPLKQGVTYFTWDPASPVWTALRGDSPPEQARVAGDYAKRLVRAHPARYAGSVVRFAALYFDPVEPRGPAVWPVSTWTLHRSLHPAQTHLLLAADSTDEWTAPATMDGRPPQRLGAAMLPLLAFQHVGRLPGPLLGLAMLLGLLLPFAARTSTLRQRLPGRIPAERRWGACLLAASGLALVLVPAATVAVSYRYLVPVLATAWPGGVIAAAALADARRPRARHAAARPRPAGLAQLVGVR